MFWDFVCLWETLGWLTFYSSCTSHWPGVLVSSCMEREIKWTLPGVMEWRESRSTRGTRQPRPPGLQQVTVCWWGLGLPGPLPPTVAWPQQLELWLLSETVRWVPHSMNAITYDPNYGLGCGCKSRTICAYFIWSFWVEWQLDFLSESYRVMWWVQQIHSHQTILSSFLAPHAFLILLKFCPGMILIYVLSNSQIAGLALLDYSCSSIQF